MSRRVLSYAGLIVLLATPVAAQQSSRPYTEGSVTGIITAWAVFNSPGRDEKDWDIILTTTYRNMAALDNLDDRTDPIVKQVLGSTEKANEGMVKRGEMRDLVGNRLVRELIIK